MKSINQHWDYVVDSTEKQVKSIACDKIVSEIEQRISEPAYQYVFDKICLSTYQEIIRFIFGIFRKQS